MKPISAFLLMLFGIPTGVFYGCSHKTSVTANLFVSSIYPMHGAVGDTITITGTGFQSSPSLDNVLFNGKSATVISASATQLLVTVPANCGTGNVVVSANGGSSLGPLFTYDIATQLTTLATGLYNPEYLTMDGSANVYVTNFGNGTVSKITPAGVVTTYASGLNWPTGITIDANGNLYVASNNSANVCTIEEITPAGAVSSFAAIPGYVYGLTIDNTGNLYAANNSNASISKITGTGNVSTYANTILGICDIKMSSDGIIYATGIAGGCIYSITPDGSVNAIITGFNFGGPNGIAIDKNGNLYFSVYGNNTLSQYNTVSKVDASGMLTTFAAGLDKPCGLVFDPNGNLYVVNMLDGTVSIIGN